MRTIIAQYAPLTRGLCARVLAPRLERPISGSIGAADRGEYRPIINLVGQAVEAGLDFYLDACHARPDEQYQQLAILAKSTGHDPNYLGLLARQGKLEAIKRGGRWYSTRAALQMYLEQAQEGIKHRGRPPRSKT